MKTSLELDRVVLLGRTFEEYSRYFGFKPEELRGKTILDVASGVSSFCAESRAQHLEVTAFDPIYEWSPEQIKKQCQHDLEFVTQGIREVNAYKWDFYKNAEGMRKFRERAYRLFLADFQKARNDRYISGKLPHTPFHEGQFDLTLVSYFLFVYEDQLDYAFHQTALAELLRITSGEVRIYPLVNFRGEPSQVLKRIRTDPAFARWSFEAVTTDFEFLHNSNSFLQIRKLNIATR